uniref:methionyl-tRNA formyltransferase n=1 Tax=Aceria tosichella TaxID=561515 RepID=A0A6G1SHN9_9ACAR
MKIDKFSLLFFGSDIFSVRILNYLLDKQLCHIQVVTKAHTVLDKFSASRQLQRNAWRDGLEDVDSDAFNIGLVASFGSIIDEETVRRFKYGLFNVHPSMLPQYRGSTPIQAAIFDDRKETGCTIMRIPPIPKFDIGDIILQERLAIRDREYAVDLRDRLADLGARMTEKFLLNYDTCLKSSRPQGEQNKSLAKKLKLEQGHLKFKSHSRDLIDRKVRAYTGFIDLYMTCLGGLLVRLEEMVEPEKVDAFDLDRLASEALNCDKIEMKIDGTDIELLAGVMYFHKIRRLLCIRSADRQWLAFRWATPDRKPRMSAADFYNGYLSKLPQESRLTDV